MTLHKSDIIWSNKSSYLIFRGTLIVLVSKADKFDDVYFNSVTEAKNYLGIK